MIDRNDKKLGELLVESGYITVEQLDDALVKQKTSGKKLGQFLVEEGVIDEGQVVDVLEFQLRIPRMNFNEYNIDPQVPRLISENLAKKHCLIPVAKEENNLIVAMVDPLDLFALDDVKLATGIDISGSIEKVNSSL